LRASDRGLFEQTGVLGQEENMGRDENRLEIVFRTWERGAITNHEFLFRVIEGATWENLQEIIDRLQPDLRDELKRVVEEAPTTDDDWKGMRIVEMYTSLETQTDAERRRTLELQQYRLGVQTIREWMRHKGDSSWQK
jgi:hypothetical protein